MNFKFEVATKQELGDLSDFIMRQLTRHFNEWARGDAGSFFALRWVKNNLVAETDSLYFLQQWLWKERHYVRYLLDPPITQESAEKNASYKFMFPA